MTTYHDYRAALETLAKLGRDQQTHLTAVSNRLDAATAAAHDIPRQAVKQTEAAKNRITQQQATGRASLARIGQDGLLPARVRPTKTAGATSGTELDRLVRAHATAVGRLDAAVRSYEQAVKADDARRQAEAQREAEERSRKRAEALAEERRRAEAARVAAEKAAQQRKAITGAVTAVLVLAVIIVVLIAST